MHDREKTIKGLEILMNGCEYIHCDDCCFCISTKTVRCGLREKQIQEDALSLLKEQDAVTIKKTKEHGFGVYGGICPKCRNWIQSAHSFCGFCGQAVKWS
jgi:hypothetical protein